MHRLFRLLAALVVAVAALAGPSRADDTAGIRAVIEDQIAAFRRDDAAGAFFHAAPGIKAMFGTPENFLAMVRSGYQPVYRPRSYAFEPLEADAGGFVQRVRVVGPDGGNWVATYTLERLPDGSFKITGCFLTSVPGGVV